jgi:class 3 adenylate cyclase/tetratricopeptide (TPR) repeat protein
VTVQALERPTDWLQPFVPRLVLDWERQAPGATWREISGSLAFVDISGFTAMTERLARRGRVGAEEMNDILNTLFTELLGVAYDDGAGLVKWGGDAVLLLYQDDDHAARASRAAANMQQAIRRIGQVQSSAGRARLRMSVGIHSGTFHFFLVGDPEIHRELVVAGPGSTRTTQMEQIAEANEVVVSPETVAQLDPSVVGPAKGEGFLLAGVPDVLFRSAPSGPDARGADLGRFIPTAIRRHLIQDDLEPEHRRIVPAFIEFAGSDGLFARCGADAVAASIDQCVRVLQRATERNGVTFFQTDISKDAWRVFLIAGFPRSLGQDEDRMLETLREIVETPLPFPVKIGVNAGPVFAAYFGPPFRKTYDVKGDAVNLAARLMARAGHGQILATEAVLDHSTALFELEPLEPFAVKGKKLEIHAWSVGRRIGSKSGGVAFPLVGRDKEVLTLREAIEGVRSGAGSAIELVGPAGIGKTRLAREFVEAARDLAHLSAICEPYQAATPYRPFRAIIRAALGVTRHQREVEVADRLRRAVAEVAPRLEPWLPLIAIPVGVHLPDTPEVAVLEERFRKARAEQAIADFLAALIREPTTFLFEDAHWMDEVSADLLEVLVSRVESLPWGICVTRRDQATGFRMPDVSGGVTLALGPLAADAVAEALEAATDDAPLRPDEIALLAERADGNPLFLTELLATYRIRGEAGLPTSIEGLVTAEIDRLPLLERRVLRTAAVIGASADAPLLEVLFGGGLEDVDWNRLSPFLENEAPGRWRFRHALMRDAAYEGLPFRRRRDLHARAGETLLLESRAGPEDVAELLSFHFYAAGRFGEAWGFSRIAGDRASATYANTEAVAFYRRAIESGKRIGAPARELASITEAVGDVRWRMGAFHEAATAYASARRLVPDKPALLALLYLKEAKVPYQAGRYVQAVRLIKRGLRLIESLEDSAAAERQVELLALFAALRGDQGRLREAERLSLEVIERAGPLRHQRVIAHAYTVLDFVYSQQGRYEGVDYLPLALEIHEERGDLYLQAEVLNNMGINEYYKGRWQRAIERYERSRDLRERVGDAEGAAVASNNIAEILVDQGRFEEAEPMFRNALRVFRSSGSGMMSGLALSNLGRSAARSGRFDEARDLFGRAEERLREVGDTGQLLENQSRLAELELLQGRWEPTIETARNALEKIQAMGGIAPQVPSLHRVIGYALAGLGRLDEARVEIEVSAEAARARDASYELALTLRALSELFIEDRDHMARWDESATQTLNELGVVEISGAPIRRETSTSDEAIRG